MTDRQSLPGHCSDRLCFMKDMVLIFLRVPENEKLPKEMAVTSE
ncbi:hypothetical protein WMO27_12090 [Lachnospiraceae bacterium CLA-AA-H183]